MLPLFRYACRITYAPVIAFGLALIAGCSEKPTEADCKKLLDHVVSLEISAAGTDKLSPEMKADLERQRKELAETVSKPFIEQCAKNTPLSLVQCGLAAKTKADYAACEKQ